MVHRVTEPRRLLDSEIREVTGGTGTGASEASAEAASNLVAQFGTGYFGQMMQDLANSYSTPTSGYTGSFDGLDIAAMNPAEIQSHFMQEMQQRFSDQLQSATIPYQMADSTSVANTTDFLEGLRWFDGSSEKTADGRGPYDHRAAAA